LPSENINPISNDAESNSYFHTNIHTSTRKQITVAFELHPKKRQEKRKENPPHTTDTVNAVQSFSSFSFWVTIKGSCNLSKSSPFMLTHTIPVPCLTINAIASGVTFDAAIIRSPSFSLSSSSTTITICNNQPTLVTILSFIIPNNKKSHFIFTPTNLAFPNILNCLRNRSKPICRAVQIIVISGKETPITRSYLCC